MALLPHIKLTCMAPLDAVQVRLTLNEWCGAAFIYQPYDDIVFWWPDQRATISDIRNRLGYELMREVSSFEYYNIPHRDLYPLPHLKLTCTSLLEAVDVLIFLREWCGQSFVDSGNTKQVSWWPEKRVSADEIRKRLVDKSLGQKVTRINYFNLPDKRKLGNNGNTNQSNGGGVVNGKKVKTNDISCLLYTSPSPRD